MRNRGLAAAARRQVADADHRHAGVIRFGVTRLERHAGAIQRAQRRQERRQNAARSPEIRRAHRAASRSAVTVRATAPRQGGAARGGITRRVTRRSWLRSRRAASRAMSALLCTRPKPCAANTRLKALAALAVVRARQNGAMQGGGLQRIVTAQRHQCAAQEAEGRQAVEEAHLAQRVGNIDRGLVRDRGAGGAATAGARRRTASRYPVPRSIWRGTRMVRKSWETAPAADHARAGWFRPHPDGSGAASSTGRLPICLRSSASARSFAAKGGASAFRLPDT